MIESIRLQDVTIFDDFEWDGLSNVNLVIGENDTGKSNLLKMLYAVTRSIRENGASPEEKPWSEDLVDKLQWTFQPRNLEIGRLVRKGCDRLSVQVDYGGLEKATFSFGESTKRRITDAEVEGGPVPFGPNTLFFPPKEVLTPLKAIAFTREQKVIGFGDTYYDLITALRRPRSHHEVKPPLKRVQQGLDDLFPGKIREREDGTFEYRRGSSRYEMSQTAEGIKKIGTLVHLIRNGAVRNGTMLLFDEPSANLHPRWILDFAELLFELSQAGVQIFIATHSYVVLKQFELLAREHEQRTPLCVLSKEDETVSARFADLSDRIPRNSIVDASVELFNRDVGLELK